jgi:hypothetical protein
MAAWTQRCSKPRVTTVRRLLSDSAALVHSAVALGPGSIVRLLLADGVGRGCRTANANAHRHRLFRAPLSARQVPLRSRSMAAFELAGCVQRGDAEATADVLCRLGRSPDDIAGLSAALVAAACSSSARHTEVFRVLLADGRADPTQHDSQAMYDAVVHGHVTNVHELLTDGRVDPGAHDSYALRLAAHFQRPDVLQLLLDDGRADPAAFDSAALVDSASAGYSDGDFGHIVRLLLADGRADVFQVGRCHPDLLPMIRAARCWRRRRPWLRAVHGNSQ